MSLTISRGNLRLRSQVLTTLEMFLTDSLVGTDGSFEKLPGFSAARLKEGELLMDKLYLELFKISWGTVKTCYQKPRDQLDELAGVIRDLDYHLLSFVTEQDGAQRRWIGGFVTQVMAMLFTLDRRQFSRVMSGRFAMLYIALSDKYHNKVLSTFKWSRSKRRAYRANVLLATQSLISNIKRED